ncbi:hypothetical protein T484DRAFT_1771283 [Baffinella frigidus]|nr:hypothetical protein T484DRAFT_1771283 [Cryptophyta sp. CCMP2293]
MVGPSVPSLNISRLSDADAAEIRSAGVKHHAVALGAASNELESGANSPLAGALRWLARRFTRSVPSGQCSTDSSPPKPLSPSNDVAPVSRAVCWDSDIEKVSIIPGRQDDSRDMHDRDPGTPSGLDRKENVRQRRRRLVMQNLEMENRFAMERKRARALQIESRRSSSAE